jgi:S-DNA-T family DNA segregation ATPase FtsK/SpoIIIE
MTEYDYPGSRSDEVVWKLFLLLSFGLVIIAWKVGSWLTRLAWRHRPIVATAAVLLGLWWRLGTIGLAVLLVVVALVLGLVRWRYPVGFNRWLREPVEFARRRRLYRQGWEALTFWHGLGRQHRDDIVVPKLRRRIRCSWWRDRLTVRPLTGHSLDTWQNQVPALVMALGAHDVRVIQGRPGWLHVDVLWLDTLAETLPAPPIPRLADVDLSCVPIGLREDRTAWTVRLPQNNILVVGVMGSGKGSVLWSILRHLAPAVVANLARVWILDPKGGMEFGLADATIAYRYADDSPEAMVELLAAAVEAMEARAKQLKRRRIRKHHASVEFPLEVIIIDELIDLLSLEGKLGAKARELIAKLLRKGRAVGFCVIGACQEPRKEVVPVRDLFPTRIGLRLDNKEQVKMVLGDGAWDAGAHCDQIPQFGAEGTAYVRQEGVRDITRARANWVDDDDIDELVAYCTTGREPVLVGVPVYDPDGPAAVGAA